MLAKRKAKKQANAQAEGAVQKAVADLRSRLSAKTLELTAAAATAAFAEAELETTAGCAMTAEAFAVSCQIELHVLLSENTTSLTHAPAKLELVGRVGSSRGGRGSTISGEDYGILFDRINMQTASSPSLPWYCALSIDPLLEFYVNIKWNATVENDPLTIKLESSVEVTRRVHPYRSL